MSPAQMTAEFLEEWGAFVAAQRLLAEYPPVQDWTDWDRRRDAFAGVYEAMIGVRFEPDSNVDELLHAAFRDGWFQAITKVAALAGLDPEALDETIDELPIEPGVNRSVAVPALIAHHDKTVERHALIDAEIEPEPEGPTA